MIKKYFPQQYYNQKLLKWFRKSSANPDPAIFLYQNKVRTPLFMMESLLRLLLKLKKSGKVKQNLKEIKKLEDVLGEIDDYDQLFLRFSKSGKLKQKELHYFEKKRDKAAHKLNKNLSKKHFYEKTFYQIPKIKIDFNSSHIVLKLQDQIERELEKCFKFYLQYPDKFDKIEGQVHEIRRKLRWISIYAQSLGGVIILVPDNVEYKWESRFITNEAKLSHYNKLPLKKDLKGYIYFNQKVFCALNFVVSELGAIKDKGLELEGITAALKATENSNRTRSLIIKQLNIDYTLNDLCKMAHRLSEDFFIKHKLHELLIIKN
jgi:hypothetical protein